MRKLYDDVTETLAKLDFESIYPGFHPFTFALYNEESVYFADRVIPQQGFYGNTTIEFEGEHIAIWHVDQDTRAYDIDTFTAGIVHEMFHAFQRENRLESNAPNDLLLLQYPDDIDQSSIDQSVHSRKSVHYFQSFVIHGSSKLLLPHHRNVLLFLPKGFRTS